jgi:uncharacterized protein YbaR (Trm112 family)
MKALLKACPRCRGDLLIDASDRERHTYACLQCGARAERWEHVAAGAETSVQRSASTQQTLTARR